MSRTKHHGDNQKKRTFGRTWWWMRNYPRWWDRLFHTKPRRAAERQAIHKELSHPEWDVLHPLDHKPHKYYWAALLALTLACGDGAFDPPQVPDVKVVVA